LAVRDVAWLDGFPKVVGLEILPENNGIWRPSAPRSVSPKLDGFCKHRALRGRAAVPITAEEKDDRAKQKNNGRKSKSEIVAIILRGVDGN
jgi:hypothetical protein